MAHNQVERDPLSGVETTGHEWDGLQELNNPLPKWWLYIFYVTIAWSVLYWVVYPAWPLGNTYTPGLLGYSSRQTAEDSVIEAKQAQAVYMERIEAVEVADILGDQELLNFAIAGGRSVFADNCAPCHSAGGQGRAGGYPVLADDDWLWGGTPDAIHQTIRYGIRNDNYDSRFSEMPAFGADGLLSRSEITDVAQYVLSLSDQAEDAAAAERGSVTFVEQCAACHGEDGKGIQDLGAPNLTDAIWLYEGTAEAIEAQVYDPKQGVMPAWTPRLDDPTIKLLAAYVHSLGGGQ